MIMKTRDTVMLALVTVVLLFLASPVSAAIKTIPAGGTVFIGEQGLDISGPTGAGAVQLGWWASGAAIAGSSPDAIVSVPDPTNFYVTPTLFGSHLGTWYLLPAKTAVFNVADPQLDIRIEDTTVNVDVTDKWVPTDDGLQFRIDSNLVPISQRAGVTSVPITIKVQSPDGAIFSALTSNSGATTSIVDYPVTTTPQYTGSIWGTSNRAIYPPGTYTIWAECNVNSMKDDYGVVGKTISRKVSVLNQDQNPLIGNKGYVTNPTTLATLVPSIKKTSIATTALTTLKTPPPTSAVPTEVPMTTEVTVMPTTSFPTPAQTKSAGFEASLAVAAMILGLAFFVKKQ
jgi:hypothetical protein